MDITTIITSTAIGAISSAIITAIFTKLSKDKTDKLQYITGERKQWRQDLRYAVVALRQLYLSKNSQHKEFNTKVCGDLKFTDYSEASSWFRARLNPTIKEEIAIYKAIKSIKTINDINDIENDIVIILKLDWERVKSEVSIFIFSKLSKLCESKELIKINKIEDNYLKYICIKKHGI